MPHTRQHWNVCKALRVLCMRQSFNLCQDPTCCIRAPTPKLAVGHRYLAVVPQCHRFYTRNQAMLLGSCMQHSGAYGTSTWSCSRHAGAWDTNAWDFADTTWASVAIYLAPSGQYCWSLGHQCPPRCFRFALRGEARDSTEVPPAVSPPGVVEDCSIDGFFLLGW